MLHYQRTIALLLFIAGVSPGWSIHAEEPGSTASASASAPTRSSGGGFDGPSSVAGQLAEDEAVRQTTPRLGIFDEALAPWFDFKTSLADDTGITFAIDYTALALGATSRPAGGEDTALGGIGRFYGNWALFDAGGENPGSLFFKGQHRTRIGTDVAPQSLGFSSGYNGLPGTAFNDQGWAVTNLYWRQNFSGGRFNVVAGIVDVTDYLNIYGLVNPLTQFQNLVFLTEGTIPAPNQGLGAAAGAALGENFYVVGGFADANGDPTRVPFDSFSDAEFFYHGELGWISSFENRYFDNVHLTGWYADARSAVGTPSDWGLAFSATRFIDGRWMPFFRAGYADGNTALLDRSIGAGIGHYWGGTKDLLGIGVNWGSPSDSSLKDQWTSEIFYRIQLAQNFAVTPSVQIIVDPALNPSKDVLAYFGLRARVTF